MGVLHRLVTAYGSISASVEAGQTVGHVWALGDISGSVTAGTGGLTVDSWGSISGNLHSPGAIAASTFDDLSGDVTSDDATISVTDWANMSGALAAPLNITIWAFGNVSGDATSNDAQVKINSYGTVSSTVSTYDGFFVDAYAVEGASLTAQTVGDGMLTGGEYEDDQLVGLRDIENTTTVVNATPPSSAADLQDGKGDVVPGVDNSWASWAVAFLMGYEFEFSLGNITNDTVLASTGAAGRLHVKSLAQQDFLEIALVPACNESLILDSHLLA